MDSSSRPWLLAYLTTATPQATGSGFTSTDGWLVVALVITLAIAATASAAETALTSVSRIKLRNRAEDGDLTAQRILKLLEDPQRFLSTILLASNVSLIVASSVATLVALDIFRNNPALRNLADVIETILLSLFVLIFIEITPKTIAVQNPELTARYLVSIVDNTSKLLSPITRALTFITNNIVRFLGGQTVRHGPFVTEEELRLLVEVGEEEGVLEEEEREMIHNVFELGDTVVREVMVPRIDMVTVEADATLDEAMQLIVQGGQSRLPVYNGQLDNILGVLYAKDLLRVLAQRQRPPSVRGLARPAYFVPESRRLDDLLRDLQQRRVHMAIVLDEYGSVSGLVTIEDLVEEIIGDIYDEYDKEERIFETVAENEFLVDAKISLDELNELLETKLTSEDYETLGGFIIGQLDKIPTVGDTVHYQNLTMTVLGTKGRRVTKVRIVRSVTPENGATPDDQPRAHEPPAEANTSPANEFITNESATSESATSESATSESATSESATNAPPTDDSAPSIPPIPTDTPTAVAPTAFTVAEMTPRQPPRLARQGERSRPLNRPPNQQRPKPGASAASNGASAPNNPNHTNHSNDVSSARNANGSGGAPSSDGQHNQQRSVTRRPNNHRAISRRR